MENYYWLIFIISIVITGIAQALVSSRYSKYKKVPNEIGMTGENVARNILDGNGLQDVAVVPVKGNLSEKRFNHSKCVMDRCIELAEKFNINNLQKNSIASLCLPSCLFFSKCLAPLTAKCVQGG